MALPMGSCTTPAPRSTQPYDSACLASFSRSSARWALRLAGVALHASSLGRFSGASFWGAGGLLGTYTPTARAQKTDNRTKIAATAARETGRGRGAVSSFILVEAFADARVADRDQLGRRQAPQVGRDAEATHPGERRHGPEEPDREERQGVALLVLQGREDVVRDVDEDDEQDQVGDPADRRVRDLESVGKGEEEREEEVPEDEDQAPVPPVAVLPDVVPDRLLGDGRVPEEEVLVERDVRPEHGEGQHQLADRPEVVGLQDPPEERRVGKECRSR